MYKCERERQKVCVSQMRFHSSPHIESLGFCNYTNYQQKERKKEREKGRESARMYARDK